MYRQHDKFAFVEISFSFFCFLFLRLFLALDVECRTFYFWLSRTFSSIWFFILRIFAFGNAFCLCRLPTKWTIALVDAQLFVDENCEYQNFRVGQKIVVQLPRITQKTHEIYLLSFRAFFFHPSLAVLFDLWASYLWHGIRNKVEQQPNCEYFVHFARLRVRFALAEFSAQSENIWFFHLVDGIRVNNNCTCKIHSGRSSLVAKTVQHFFSECFWSGSA